MAAPTRRRLMRMIVLGALLMAHPAVGDSPAAPPAPVAAPEAKPEMGPTAAPPDQAPTAPLAPGTSAPVVVPEAKPEMGPTAAPDHAPPPAEPKTVPVPPQKPGSVPTAPANLESINSDEVVAVLGKKVRGANGKDILGAVVDILIDREGRPRAAIIDFGGFLGVGTRKIAVEWPLLKIRPDDHDAPLLLSLERAQIQAAPEYKETAQPANVVAPPTPSDAGK